MLFKIDFNFRQVYQQMMGVRTQKLHLRKKTLISGWILGEKTGMLFIRIDHKYRKWKVRKERHMREVEIAHELKGKV